MLGHEAAWESWRAAMHGERMHHAWLLSGRRGLGKARFARGWLFWMGGVGVAGVVLVAMAGLLWLRSLRIESAFVALTAIPNFFN